ncbi:MAG: hypothetical protein ABIN37_19010 [Burkholderiaceae bacterium]
MTNPCGIKPLLAIGLALVLACGTALAAKPEGDGRAHNRKQQRTEQNREQVKVGAYFEDRQRMAAKEYYGKQGAGGRCPPGLAKKNNGCQPPGQAKKWALGQPLPSTVVIYPVPRSVVVSIGTPPPGYKYVRVANDILLIAVGTQMVIDAIEDLMRL